MGREIDWGAAEYGAQFALMVRAVHIKYRDGGVGSVGGGARVHTLHSTLICLMDGEAFKWRNAERELGGGWKDTNN